MAITSGARFIGLASPVTKKSQGYFTPSIDIELIKSSIEVILGTRIGEYPMRPTFGSKLYQVPFDQNDAVTRALVEEFVVEAINKWEPRVTIIGFNITQDEHEINTTVNFSLKDYPVTTFDVQFILERQ